METNGTSNLGRARGGDLFLTQVEILISLIIFLGKTIISDCIGSIGLSNQPSMDFLLSREICSPYYLRVCLWVSAMTIGISTAYVFLPIIYMFLSTTNGFLPIA